MKVKIVERTCARPSEVRAAEILKRQLLEKFPDVPTDQRIAYLIVAHDCSGDDVRDVDILAFIDAYTHVSCLNKNDKSVKCYVKSIAVAIEVCEKDEFVPEMDHVIVKYPSGKRDKTEQNRMQCYQLNEQLDWLMKMRGIEVPKIWFDPVLWMINYQKPLDPIFRKRTMNSEEGLERLLEIVASRGTVDKDGDMIKNCWSKMSNKSFLYLKKELISLYDLVERKQLNYGILTRKNIDNICINNLENNDRYREQGMRGFLCLDGKPGTGKTVTMLLIAYNLLSDDIEVMFLTYNLALAYDVKQMWWHLKTKKNVEGDLSVQSQYQFFGRLWSIFRKMLGQQGSTPDKDFYENYEDQYLPIMLRSLKAMSTEEVLRLKRDNNLLMQKVLVDEGQDWHAAEVEILEILYSKERLIVAQSAFQLVRSVKNMNWSAWLGGSGGRKDDSYWEMKSNMRLKTNLVEFCNELASNMNMRYKLTKDKSKGGEVKLISGDLANHADLIEQTFVRHEKVGKGTPYEYLVLTPDTNASVENLRGLNRLCSEKSIINLSSYALRSGFSNSLDIFSQEKVRYVNYQSARGLEGWTCLCLSIDRFWEELDKWFDKIHDSKPSVTYLQQQIQTDTPEESRSRFKFNWLMIALSRAVDQLILHVDDEQSEIAKIMTECIISTSR